MSITETNMKLQEIVDDVFYLKFKTRRKLCKTLLRFEEFYESPEFRGKIFSLEEFKEWYTKNSPKGKKTRKFTYYSDWRGFNIPSHAFEPFYQGKFNPLSVEEKGILDLLRNKRKGKFYLIATFGKAPNYILRHEIAHGLYYTNQNYRKQARKIISKIDSKTKNSIQNFLAKSGGYSKAVWPDEMQAHMHSLPKLRKSGLNTEPLNEIGRKMKDLLDTYINQRNL